MKKLLLLSLLVIIGFTQKSHCFLIQNATLIPLAILIPDVTPIPVEIPAARKVVPRTAGYGRNCEKPGAANLGEESTGYDSIKRLIFTINGVIYCPYITNRFEDLVHVIMVFNVPSENHNKEIENHYSIVLSFADPKDTTTQAPRVNLTLPLVEFSKI